MGWYSDNSGGTVHAVGEKTPNAWGIYDMHGNVAEWCADVYWSSYGIPHEELNPRTAHILRGGGYADSETACRSARRAAKLPWLRAKGLGFRVVLEDQSEKP